MMKIKSLGIGALAALLLAGTAIASDLPSRAPAPAPVFVSLARISWTGFYAGLQAGYAFNGKTDFAHENVNTFGGPGGTYENDGKGGLIGARAGYSHQFGSLVAGIEATYDYGRIKGDDNGAYAQYNNATASKLQHLVTVAPTFGVLITDRTLVFGKAGYAGAQVSGSQVYAPAFGTVTTWSQDKWAHGWTVGGGVRYAILPNVRVGVEYDYVRLQRSTLSGNDSNGFVTQISARPSIHAVKGTIDYAF